MSGPRPLGDATFRIVQGLAWRRAAEALHKLGPAPLGYLLAEIAAALDAEELVAARLARYAALDPEVVRVLGADRFAPPPLYPVHREAA